MLGTISTFPARTEVFVPGGKEPLQKTKKGRKEEKQRTRNNTSGARKIFSVILAKVEVNGKF